MSHATAQELADWLNASDLPAPQEPAASRLLARATELVDDTVTARYDPADPAVVKALGDACCAVVEQWLDIGEGWDIDGYPADTSVHGGRVTTTRRPAVVAPRARRVLRQAGLLRGSLS